MPGVTWLDEAGLDNAWLPELERAVVAALRQQGAALDSTLRVLLADDAELQRLNHDFLGHDEPTDVLSFPSGGDPQQPGDLGDVALSIQRAVHQAEVSGHSLLAELQLLLVHATLHLLGHDHASAEDKAVMWRAQAQIVDALGIAVRLPA